MSGNNLLTKENLLLKRLLQNKVVVFNEIIGPGFNFGYITRKDSPKEFFAAAVLHKLYSLDISAENILLTNDIFLSECLYRYVYELYLKVFYIFSAQTDEEILFRVNDYFESKDLKIVEYQEGINDNLAPKQIKEDHKEKYKMMCKFAHPNIESLNMHIGKTSDQQFNFLVPTIYLILWHSVEIVRLFSNLKLLGLNERVDQGGLISLQNDSFIK